MLKLFQWTLMVLGAFTLVGILGIIGVILVSEIEYRRTIKSEESAAAS